MHHLLFTPIPAHHLLLTTINFHTNSAHHVLISTINIHTNPVHHVLSRDINFSHKTTYTFSLLYKSNINTTWMVASHSYYKNICITSLIKTHLTPQSSKSCLLTHSWPSFLLILLSFLRIVHILFKNTLVLSHWLHKLFSSGSLICQQC